MNAGTMTRVRATAMQLLLASAPGDGVNVLFVDSPAAQQFEHWIVDSCCVNGFDPGGSLNPLPAFSGLYLCPPQFANNPPILDQNLFWGIPLPLDSDAGLTFWSPPTGVGASASVTKRFIVPPLWFIRGILNSAGPGATTAVIEIVASIIKERQCGQDAV